MTAIAPYMSAFLREHLPQERRASPHTCDTYAYAFQLLLCFAATRIKTQPLLRCAPTDKICCRIPSMKAPGQVEMPCSIPSAPYRKGERNTPRIFGKASRREERIASALDRCVFYTHELA